MTAAHRQLFWCVAALDQTPTPTSRLLAPAPRLEAVDSPMPLQKASYHHSQWRLVQRGYPFNAILEIAHDGGYSGGPNIARRLMRQSSASAV